MAALQRVAFTLQPQNFLKAFAKQHFQKILWFV